MSVLVVLLLVAALVIGGIWLFAEVAMWVLIIALVLFAAGAISGIAGRGRARA